jgi:DNA-binding SARP family transcriptional activator
MKPPAEPALRLRLLGPLAVYRHENPLELPRSRKARALLAWLALSPRVATRSEICDLLWDAPADPRGELRGCLTKVRPLVDTTARKRLLSREGGLELDLRDCDVDALAILKGVAAGVPTLAPERQRELLTLFNGAFLEGLEVSRSPVFDTWLTAHRRRFRACHVALLEHVVHTAPESDRLQYLDRWRELAPFDLRVHRALLETFAKRGELREAEEHIEATTKLFEADGVDPSALHTAWRVARKSMAATSTPEGRIEAVAAPRQGLPAAGAARRASVAITPFVDVSPVTNSSTTTAGALAHDVITRLAKLRSIFVIAQGSVFALHERGVGAEETGRILNVDYVTSGAVRRDGQRFVVQIELSETRTARVIWAETFDQSCEDAFVVLDDIGNRIVAAIASEIELMERNRAILRPPNSLDAWDAHHRGLWHMYRFTRRDNQQALGFFQTAVRLDPTFARARAGLSFTHFQNAFQRWGSLDRETGLAYDAASQSLVIDDRDPAAHWAMGRALWLRGDQTDAIDELNRAVELSPNFAVGHYALAFVHSQAGDPHAAIASSDQSRLLSPFDPLMFGMLGSRAMALVRLGDFAEAASWAVRAATRPNAHAHIHAIAAFSLALAGSLSEARSYAATIRKRRPGYTIEDFLQAFRHDEEGAARFREGAQLLGMG